MKAFAAVMIAAGLMIASEAQAEVREFRTVAVDIGGVRFWLPSTFIVKKGDVVRIKAVSKVTAQGLVDHGFSIPAFGIEKVVGRDEQVIEFTADKEGIFPMNCQLHPGHVGGQLVVLSK